MSTYTVTVSVQVRVECESEAAAVSYAKWLVEDGKAAKFAVTNAEVTWVEEASK